MSLHDVNSATLVYPAFCPVDFVVLFLSFVLFFDKSVVCQESIKFICVDQYLFLTSVIILYFLRKNVNTNELNISKS